ncbi:MAG: pentapeptide repeat-containing protein [Chloroflexi bacterium]|nr:pentapeptide repeat-containing protein [Chloroflexota bacterium]
MESGSSTLRNFGLVIAGALALLLAIWRSWVAHRQAATAEQHLLNERYRQGAEMLGSDILSVRLGGIYALHHLAVEYPNQYHLQIMELLCAFVRHPTVAGCGVRQPNLLGKPGLREDLQAILTAIGARHGRQLKLEKGARFRLDLRSARIAGAWLEGACLASANLHDADLTDSTLLAADLSGARLPRADLSNADLTNSDLTCTTLVRAKLPGACLDDASLVNARLNNATLSRASLAGSDLSGATLYQAKLYRAELSQETRLTQAQLNQARADPDDPPILDGAVDAETGEPLVWRDDLLDGQM